MASSYSIELKARKEVIALVIDDITKIHCKYMRKIVDLIKQNRELDEWNNIYESRCDDYLCQLNEANSRNY